MSSPTDPAREAARSAAIVKHIGADGEGQCDHSCLTELFNAGWNAHAKQTVKVTITEAQFALLQKCASIAETRLRYSNLETGVLENAVMALWKAFTDNGLPALNAESESKEEPRT